MEKAGRKYGESPEKVGTHHIFWKREKSKSKLSKSLKRDQFHSNYSPDRLQKRLNFNLKLRSPHFPALRERNEFISPLRHLQFSDLGLGLLL